jgi:prepilin-type N-terminal cleavage/methylation domain-containing protein
LIFSQLTGGATDISKTLPSLSMNKTAPVSRSVFSRQMGFSLVEMIGVLAIIAILAVVIVPKVFSTIASSRITSTVGSVSSMKPAVAEFVGKFGALPIVNGANRFDDVLVSQGFLEGRFVSKLGTPSNAGLAAGTWTRSPLTGAWAVAGAGVMTGQTKLITFTRAAAAPAAPNGSFYLLDGVTPLPAGSQIVSAMIAGVPINEARELSSRIDGEGLTEIATSMAADLRGKVTYTGAGATRTVFVYIAHQ